MTCSAFSIAIFLAFFVSAFGNISHLFISKERYEGRKQEAEDDKVAAGLSVS